MVDNVSCKLFGPTIQNEGRSVQYNSEYDHENDDCNIPELIMDSSQCIPSTLMECDNSCIPSEGSLYISCMSTGCDIHHSLSTLTGHDVYCYICICCHWPNIKEMLCTLILVNMIWQMKLSNKHYQVNLQMEKWKNGKMSQVVTQWMSHYACMCFIIGTWFGFTE